MLDEPYQTGLLPLIPSNIGYWELEEEVLFDMVHPT
ncbi:hypothetical protein, partial [Salmonella enterica]